MIKKTLTALALALVALSAAADNLAAVQKRVVKADTLCGSFHQQKILFGMTKSVQSDGRFCVDKNKGILWRVQTPHASTTKITQKEIVQYAGNKAVSRISAEKQPVVAMINKVLAALAVGDFSPLKEYFTVTTTIKPAQWQIMLVGNSEETGAAVKRIIVTGDKYVQRLRMTDTNGDITFIALSNIETGKKAVKADDSALYD